MINDAYNFALNTCDYVPFVSTLTNTIVLFQAFVPVANPAISQSTISDHVYKYSEQIQITRCIVLLVPLIGNIAILLYDLNYTNYKNLILAAVMENGWALESVSPSYKNDLEVVLAAVKHIGVALQFASDELKNNREVVLAAVRQCGEALQFASDELKNDPEIVLAAMRQSGGAIQFANHNLQNNPDSFIDHKEYKNLMLAAVMKNGWVLEFVTPALKNDPEVVFAAVKQNFGAYMFVGKNLKVNDRAALEALVVRMRIESDAEHLRWLETVKARRGGGENTSAGG